MRSLVVELVEVVEVVELVEVVEVVEVVDLVLVGSLLGVFLVVILLAGR